MLSRARNLTKNAYSFANCISNSLPRHNSKVCFEYNFVVIHSFSQFISRNDGLFDFSGPNYKPI